MTDDRLTFLIFFFFCKYKERKKIVQLLLLSSLLFFILYCFKLICIPMTIHRTYNMVCNKRTRA